MRKKQSCVGVWVSSSTRIVVAGAGAIGCYVGGRLAASGHNVSLLARQRIADALTSNGLTVTDYLAQTDVVDAPNVSTDPSSLQAADLVLVAVKSAATPEIAKSIQRYAPKAQVVSLQNGVSNADLLRRHLPEADVRASVVEFNVVETGPGVFKQATSGGIIFEDTSSDMAKAYTAPGLTWQASDQIRSVQWGKLLVNLNNALNALSGLTLLEQLQNRAWRKVLAAQMAETLTVLRAAGIKPAQFTAVAPGLVPHVLRLPTPIFRRAAKAMLTIDPAARSSMQDDLVRGRITEIDVLQGEVQTLGRKHDVETPTIDAVLDAIKVAERAGNGPPGLDPRTLGR